MHDAAFAKEREGTRARTFWDARVWLVAREREERCIRSLSR